MATNKHPSLKAYKRKQAADKEKNKELAYRMYLVGHGVCEIAKHLGYANHSQVSLFIKEALEDHRQANEGLKTQIKALELHRLDELQAVFYKEALKADKDAYYVIKSIMERRAKYLGLDSPTEVKTEVHQKAYVGFTLDEWDQVKQATEKIQNE